MSNINDISCLYEHIVIRDQLSLDETSEYYDEELANLVENIISTISFNMISEGYTAEGVVDFLENSPEETLVEYYFNLPLLDENFVLDESTLIEFARLEEALGAGLRLLGRGLKPAGRLIKVATKRAMGPGVRKNLASATTKVKDVATKAKTNIPSKEKVKSGAKTALGLGAATLAGYAGGKAAGGRDAKTTPSDTTSSTTPSAPSQSPSEPSSSGEGGGGKPSGPSGGSGGGKPSGSKGSTPPKPSKDSDNGPAGETPMQKWARLHPKLASKVKSGQSGYEEISAKREKPGPNEKQDQTPTTGNAEAKIDTKEVESSIKAQQEREKKKMESSTKKESYDAYDLVLEYLFDTEQAETLTEAHYVMMEMDSTTIQAIVHQQSQPIIEQIDFLINGLLEEGYDLSNYTEEDLVDVFINEGILNTFAKTVFAINNARKAAATVKGVKAATKATQTTIKSGKGGALVKSPSAAITKSGSGGGGGALVSGGSGGGKGGSLVKSPGGKMVDQSVKPVNVKDVTKGGALVSSPKGAMTKTGGKGGGLVAAGGSGGSGGGKGRGGKGGLVAAGLLGAGAAGAGMLASQGKDKKTSPRRQEALVGSQNAKKPLTASSNNMAVAKDVNKQGGVALGKGGLGYLAKKGDKMVIKQAKAVGADDGVIGKAARALGLTKAKDKAIEAQRQAAGRTNREKYLSGQGLTDKNITGYQAKGAKRKGEITGTKIKMDNN